MVEQVGILLLTLRGTLSEEEKQTTVRRRPVTERWSIDDLMRMQGKPWGMTPVVDGIRVERNEPCEAVAQSEDRVPEVRRARISHPM